MSRNVKAHADEMRRRLSWARTIRGKIVGGWGDKPLMPFGQFPIVELAPGRTLTGFMLGERCWPFERVVLENGLWWRDVA